MSTRSKSLRKSPVVADAPTRAPRSVSPPHARHVALATRILRAVPGRGDDFGTLPTPDDIAGLVDDLLALMFPGWGRSGLRDAGDPQILRWHLAEVLVSLERRLTDAVRRCLLRAPKSAAAERRAGVRAATIAGRFIETLPEIRAMVMTDAEAHFRSDPAATGIDEVVSCYPGIYAIAIYRAAHRLIALKAPIVPRMMTEHAHARTGIDIHPGARIGRAFFIDHGTGIVIGETTVIGNNVRIYQGVTLGALSVKRRAHATPTGQRHPTIEDDVIIYANATILGGKTVIGRGAVVGGNAWITFSVPPGTHVGVGT